MAHDVFISYSTKDKMVADAVCAKLESHKIRCWIAPRDVPAGQPYAASLVKAIRASSIIVLILSQGSNQSTHVLREVGEAVDNGIPILPLRIEDVNPTDELHYYIKSIHWLDAMSPPLERHLEKLTGSVLALINVREQPPLTTDKTPIESSSRLPRVIPVWAIILLALLAIGILGITGTWVLKQQHEVPLVLSTQTSTVINTEGIISVSSPSPGDMQWRTLSFIIPSETLWRAGDNSYTTIAKPSQDTIAWSDEIIEGDFILSAQVNSEQSDGIAHFIIYGDGIGFSEGCLIFTYQNGFIYIERDTLYGTNENFLMTIKGNYGFQVPTHDFTIEINQGAATFFVDGNKEAYTFLPSETKRLGRIGFFADWEESVGMTYSNIKIVSLIESK
jgi:hypothetical protein